MTMGMTMGTVLIVMFCDNGDGSPCHVLKQIT